MNFKDLSLKQKLTLIILATSGLMIIIISMIFFINEVLSTKQTVLSNISTIAGIAARNSTAALSFDDPETGEELLNALKAEPHIVAAALYDKDGKLFVKIKTIQDEVIPKQLRLRKIFRTKTIAPGLYVYSRDSSSFLPDFLDVVSPVRLKGRIIGAVFMRVDQRWILAHIKVFALTLLGIMFVLIVLSYFISSRLQKIVSEPIEILARTMQKVKTQHDFSIRVSSGRGKDEIGMLMDGFNNMLQQVQERDQRLKENSEQLQRQVALRTEALKLSEAQKKKLWQQKRIQQAYGELVSRMNSVDVDEMVDTCLNQIAEVMGACWAAIFIHDEDTREPQARKIISLGAIGSIEDAHKGFLQQLSGLAKEKAKEVKGTGRFVIESINSKRGEDGTLDIELMAFPIRFHERDIGALVIAVHQIPDDYSVTFLLNATKQLGVAIHNAMTFQDLVKKSAELKHSNLELERASRMKSDFLANMSHELRTPLNAIIGFSELLLDEHFGQLNDTQKDYLTDVLESGRHLLALINDILDLSKIEAGKVELDLEDVNIKDVLKSGLTMIHYKAMKHNIELSLKLDDSVPDIIVADQQKLRQIVYNLVSNAVKFTDKGGRIELGATKVDGKWLVENVPEPFMDRQIINSRKTKDPFLMISVEDTGIGMEEEHLTRIFDAFEQVDSSRSKKYKGTGLGLALCKNLVAMHGGIIWAESTPGKGSLFSFAIPMRRS